MLKTGGVLTLRVRENDGVERYRCKVQDVFETEFLVDYPVHMSNGKTTYILNGKQLNISFVTEEGTAFSFDSEVLGRVKHGIPMIQLSYPGHENLIKIQRRQYVRVESNVDVAVHSLLVDFPPFTTVTHDISAGGCSLILPDGINFPETEHILTNFVFHLNNGDIHYLKLKSKVIRMEEVSTGRERVSLQFDQIKENERQLIIKYCFEQQLLFRKKLV